MLGDVVICTELTCVVLCVRVLSGGLGSWWWLCQFEVIFALFAHPVGVGAASIPLDPDPAILAQLPDDTAKTWSRTVLDRTCTKLKTKKHPFLHCFS